MNIKSTKWAFVVIAALIGTLINYFLGNWWLGIIVAIILITIFLSLLEKFGKKTL
ncbi:MAG: hypothetical protein V1697_02595 [Candidatus Levyibacteriota bacterium]